MGRASSAKQLFEAASAARRLKKDPVTDKYVTYSHKKSGTISSLHYDVENLAVTEVIHTGSFCLGDEAMQLDEEEDVE